MTEQHDLYLVWSNEHAQWWRPGGYGYTPEIKEAGAFRRERAIEICRKALPGTFQELGMLPEIPVRMADLAEMMKL